MKTLKQVSQTVDASPGITAREANSFPHRNLLGWTVGGKGHPDYVDRFEIGGTLCGALADLPADTHALVVADSATGAFIVWHFGTKPQRLAAAQAIWS